MNTFCKPTTEIQTEGDHTLLGQSENFKSLIRKTSEFPKIYVYNFLSPSAETLFSVWTHRRVQSVRFTFEDPFDI